MTNTTTSGALVSRQAAAPVPAVPEQAIGHVAGVGGHLPDVLQVCNAIASAGDLIPSAYRNKPGAVLLAKMWADKHDIDLFTALQHVYPIQGKPYVSAEMRVALATAAGFEFKVTQSDRTVCVVEVWRAGERLGMITSAIGDIPEATRKKDNWKNHPDDMLFADACRKADRRYVKTAAALLDVAQDYEDEAPDVVDVLTPQPGDLLVAMDGSGDVIAARVASEPTTSPGATATAPSLNEVMDASGVAPTLNEVMDAATSKKLKPLRLVAALKGMGYEVTAVGDVVDNPEALMDLADWVRQA